MQERIQRINENMRSVGDTLGKIKNAATSFYDKLDPKDQRRLKRKVAWQSIKHLGPIRSYKVYKQIKD